MKKLKISAVLILCLALIAFIIQNTGHVSARFLWMSADVPVVVIIIIAAVGGFSAGLLLSLLSRDDLKKK